MVRERERERERELSSLLGLKIFYGHITFSALKTVFVPQSKSFLVIIDVAKQEKIFFHCTPKQTRPYLVEKKKKV